ncbi:MAG: tyrosine-type recombinase/integrase [Gemmataceae bacterium]
MAKKARRGRGEGSVNELPSGRWYAEISLGFDGAGKRIRRRAYAATKRDAQAALRRLQAEADRGGVPAPGALTVGRLVDDWLAAMKATWEDGTYDTHSRNWRNHARLPLGGVRLAKLTPSHVLHLMKTLDANGVSPAMRRQVLVTVRAALEYAVRVGLAAHNPAARVPLPAKPKGQAAGVSHEEVLKFLAAAVGDRLYALYPLAVDSGLRESELLGMTWRHVDLDRGTVAVVQALEEVSGRLKLKVPKTRTGTRSLTLSPVTVAALAGHRQAMLSEGHCTPDTPVFCGVRSGSWMRKADVWRQSFDKIRQRAGTTFHFHMMRHASASLLLAHGADVKTVQSRLGHSTAATTMDVYAHALDRGQQKAADLMTGILGGAVSPPAMPHGGDGKTAAQQ